jgi:hypothetical protein
MIIELSREDREAFARIEAALKAQREEDARSLRRWKWMVALGLVTLALDGVVLAALWGLP